jgi:hypothetical protein
LENHFFLRKGNMQQTEQNFRAFKRFYLEKKERARGVRGLFRDIQQGIRGQLPTTLSSRFFSTPRISQKEMDLLLSGTAQQAVDRLSQQYKTVDRGTIQSIVHRHIRQAVRALQQRRKLEKQAVDRLSKTYPAGPSRAEKAVQDAARLAKTVRATPTMTMQQFQSRYFPLRMQSLRQRKQALKK